MPKKINKEIFIERAIVVHGNLYNYDNIVYTGIFNKIKINCKNHGVFEQTPDHHLRGQGCAKCAGNLKLDIEEFIKKAIKVHGDKYIYDEVNYINSNSRVKIICKIHNVFWQIANDHLQGNGCSKCSNKCFITKKEFIKKAKEIHKDLYDYKHVIYTGNKNKVKIICNKKNHGIFEQRPSDHINKKHGCPKCVHTISKLETLWLDKLNVTKEFRNKTIKINKKVYKPDAIDLENKIVWEFYGDYYHGNPLKYDQDKINKTNKKIFGQLYNDTVEKEKNYKDAGYKVISIWEKDFIEGSI